MESLVNSERSQPAYLASSIIPANRAIRSSSEGHTNRKLCGPYRKRPSASRV